MITETERIRRMRLSFAESLNLKRMAAEIFRDGVDREVLEPAVPICHRFD
jgi:hypothetical protein